MENNQQKAEAARLYDEPLISRSYDAEVRRIVRTLRKMKPPKGPEPRLRCHGCYWGQKVNDGLIVCPMSRRCGKAEVIRDDG